MSTNPEKLVEELIRDISSLDLPGSLQYITRRFRDQVVFSSSLGLEDQVITHMIWETGLAVDIFTLDTGRLFAETYSLMERLHDRYGKRIRVCFPDSQQVEQLVSEKGPNCFYESVENRKACCGIRKVKPLAIALEGAACWITGIRAGQSDAREKLQIIEWDSTHGLIKFHPLLHWSLEEIRTFIQVHGIPYNPLHDRGFPSIGCAPCTRALKPGEPLRAGRWWWEDNRAKECGLHIHPESTGMEAGALNKRL